MISFKSRGFRFPTEGLRCFSLGSLQCHKSHYDTLNISPSATQAEVKSAYYKLSKKYHPDTNVNDPTATEKFQEISEAYETLGNEDARMRYDKGMSPVDRLARRKPGSKVPEDPRAAFYKSRLQNKMSSPTAGRVYNFDDWTKNHYSQSIKTNKILRDRVNDNRGIRYTEDSETKARPVDIRKAESRLAYTLVGIFLVLALLYELEQPDTPKPKQ